MTEASHSIIGMLSAKPLDMETGTGNNAFNALLTSGESRPDVALLRDDSETIEEPNSDAFLEQMINPDQVSISTAQPSKTRVGKIVDDADHRPDQIIATELPTDIGAFVSKMSSPMLAADRTHSDNTSHSTGSFNAANASIANRAKAENLSSSQRQPLAPEHSVNRSTPIATDATPPSRNAVLNIDSVAKIPTPPINLPADDMVSGRDAAAQRENKGEGRKAIAQVNLSSRLISETREPRDESSKEYRAIKLSDHAIVRNRSPEALKPTLQNLPANPIGAVTGNNGKESAVPSHGPSGGLDKNSVPATDIEIHARAVIDVLRGKTPGAAAPSISVGPTRPALDNIDPKASAAQKFDPIKGSDALELKKPMLPAAAEKSMTTGLKPFAVDGKNSSVDLGLQDQVDLPTATAAAATLGASSLTQKSVNFDSNAPQFPERFASEIGDLKINGDLKKFELNPRNLGRLEVSFVTRGGTEMLMIEADNEAARDMILKHGQAIQDLLKSQGRTDLGLRIDLRDNGLAGGHNETMAFDRHDNETADNRDAKQAIRQSQSQLSESEDSADEATDTSRYA
ncbi:MAG: hypothetical protein ABJO01_14170 [Parasphingorhabdus sp.]|uniref:hypothetical protein n=1 Tax=Parasphingorhabdus sp. TaxID=2709688 RepID=UPI003298DCB7